MTAAMRCAVGGQQINQASYIMIIISKFDNWLLLELAQLQDNTQHY